MPVPTVSIWTRVPPPLRLVENGRDSMGVQQETLIHPHDLERRPAPRRAPEGPRHRPADSALGQEQPDVQQGRQVSNRTNVTQNPLKQLFQKKNAPVCRIVALQSPFRQTPPRQFTPHEERPKNEETQSRSAGIRQKCDHCEHSPEGFGALQRLEPAGFVQGRKKGEI